MTSAAVHLGLTPPTATGATLLLTLRPLFRTEDSGASTLLVRDDRGPGWLSTVVAQLLDMGEGAGFVDERALRRGVEFLAQLPPAMPEPFVAIGDDGSVGVEWEYPAGHLYLTFAGVGDEVYWSPSTGAEWEGPLVRSIPKLVDAIFGLMKDVRDVSRP